ncbi:hypothetical protein GMOD_00000827 [Pyrenophora seminiperda CCB06]|uniref:DUF202 domain-containing protein n=1 Tax=Pyrenophora seminiperda CCB06 TaxID=1302712 RepID=A0A3M7M850_9PLEO|nr:hypothetical protein GMOD_00000827 [Pyrenophora seminiperda CCB06]
MTSHARIKTTNDNIIPFRPNNDNDERLKEPALHTRESDIPPAPTATAMSSAATASPPSGSNNNNNNNNNPRKRTTTTTTTTTTTAATPNETSPMYNTSAPTSTPKDYNTLSPPSLRAGHLNAVSTVEEASASAEEEEQGQGNHTTPPLNLTRSAQRVAAAIERREKSAWAGFWEKYGSVELDNKGSVARDHLALERTFLAWLRTSLSFASIGIAITQLFRLNTSLSNAPSSSNNNHSTTAATSSAQAKLRHLGKPLGATFIGISIVMLLIGFHRYFEAQHYVIRGKFPASRGSIILVSVIAGALIASSLAVILVTAPGAFET